MTFKEILSRFDFAEIAPAFLHLWQTNEPKLSEHVELDKRFIKAFKRCTQRPQATHSSRLENYRKI